MTRQQWPIWGIFNELLLTQNVNVACNVKCDFFVIFKHCVNDHEMMHIQVLHLEGHKLQLQLCTEAFLLMTELIFILSDVIFQCIIQFYLRSIISHSPIVVLYFGELMHGPHIKSGHKMNFPENWNGYIALVKFLCRFWFLAFLKK